MMDDESAKKWLSARERGWLYDAEDHRLRETLLVLAETRAIGAKLFDALGVVSDKVDGLHDLGLHVEDDRDAWSELVHADRVKALKRKPPTYDANNTPSACDVCGRIYCDHPWE